jgi:hypothetical protein
MLEINPEEIIEKMPAQKKDNPGIINKIEINFNKKNCKNLNL